MHFAGADEIYLLGGIQAVAIGKIGDRSQLGILAQMQQSAPKETQPAVAAAICLLGTRHHEVWRTGATEAPFGTPGTFSMTFFHALPASRVT